MTVQELTIEHLAEHCDIVPEIVSWIYLQWGPMYPEMTLSGLTESFGGHTTPHKIPETFVALLEGEIIGTASLVHHDMSTHMDLSPWLAAVYIKSEFREKGFGSKLVQAVTDEATLLGLERFYLFTPNRASFYERLGWQRLEKTTYRGEQVTIMVYEIEQ